MIASGGNGIGTQPTDDSKWRLFVRLLSLGRGYSGWYAALAALTFAMSTTGVLTAELLRRIVNAAAEKDMAVLLKSGYFALAIVLLEAVGGYAKGYFTGMLEYKSTIRLQAAVLGKLMRVKMHAMDRYHSSDLINRIHDSAGTTQSGVNDKSLQLLGNVLQAAFILTYLLVINVWLTLGALVISFVTPILLTPLSKPLGKWYGRRQEARAAQEAWIQDTIQGAEAVRSLSLAERTERTFQERYSAHLKLHYKVVRMEAVVYRLPVLVFVGGMLYVLAFGGYSVIQGTLDIGAVMAFFIAFERLANPVSQLASLWTQLQEALANGKRVFELLDLPEELESKPRPQENEHAAGTGEPAAAGIAAVRFEGVRFGYGEHDEVLRGVSFVVDSGRTTALVGPSGGGKSTLIGLLLRLYEPHGGTITSGGRPLDTIDLASWRASIAYVSQEPTLFSGTLYDNIVQGRPGASEEEVVSAAKAASIHDFIASTANGYRTVIGERGILLSGGERQRVAIARAMLKDPRLLLLDEPTSALDSHNEEAVQRALDTLMHGRTTIVIAHRLSTIRDADRIVFLEEGAVAEEGTHAELMERCGKYYTMHETALRENKADAGIWEARTQ